MQVHELLGNCFMQKQENLEALNVPRQQKPSYVMCILDTFACDSSELPKLVKGLSLQQRLLQGTWSAPPT